MNTAQNTADTHLEIEVSHLLEGATVIATFGAVVGALLAAGMISAVVTGVALAGVSYALIKN